MFKLIEKFEIKSHDGPGRVGKINDAATPKLFFKNDIKIAPSEGSAYNIDREIAQFNVKETLRLAKENVDKCNVAAIQGSKYIDLRIDCLKQLEEVQKICEITAFDELIGYDKATGDLKE